MNSPVQGLKSYEGYNIKIAEGQAFYIPENLVILSRTCKQQLMHQAHMVVELNTGTMIKFLPKSKLGKAIIGTPVPVYVELGRAGAYAIVQKGAAEGEDPDPTRYYVRLEHLPNLTSDSKLMMTADYAIRNQELLKCRDSLSDILYHALRTSSGTSHIV